MKIFIISAFLTILSIQSKAQKTITSDFIRTYNIYRTWTEGQTPGEYNRLKWQVRFSFSENTIKMYWEKDGFPSTKFVLTDEYEIVESRKMDANVYGYNTRNKITIMCDTGSTDNIMIKEGKKITEYIYYSK